MASVHPIHGQMPVHEIIALVPEGADIMAEYGLHCFSCSIGGMETLEEGCQMHGFTEDMIIELIDDLNTALSAIPQRPASLTVTSSAADGIAEIARSEGRATCILQVMVDQHGGFCLEFTDAKPEGDLSFCAPERPDVLVTASPVTLQRIGGTTIDMREGRFKLDLLEDAAVAKDCCGEGGGCGCHG